MLYRALCKIVLRAQIAKHLRGGKMINPIRLRAPENSPLAFAKDRK
jgi:hypothetical protein